MGSRMVRGVVPTKPTLSSTRMVWMPVTRAGLVVPDSGQRYIVATNCPPLDIFTTSSRRESASTIRGTSSMVMFSGLISLVLLKPLPWMVMLSLALASVLVRVSPAGFTVILVAALGPFSPPPCALYLDNALDGVASNGGRHHEGASGRAIRPDWVDAVRRHHLTTQLQLEESEAGRGYEVLGEEG